MAKISISASSASTNPLDTTAAATATAAAFPRVASALVVFVVLDDGLAPVGAVPRRQANGTLVS